MDWQALVELQPSLAHIPPALRATVGHRQVETGETLFRIGDPVKNMFFIAAGEVQLVRHGLHGKKIILQRSRSGFFAEASMDSKAYHCNAVAAAAGEMLNFIPVRAQ